MSKIDFNTVPNLPTNPIFDGMPESLKDVKCFDDIESQLRIAILSDHKHNLVKSYINCKRCKAKFDKRRQLMKDFGFKDIRQYSTWKKIMMIIKSGKDIKLS